MNYNRKPITVCLIYQMVIWCASLACTSHAHSNKYTDRISIIIKCRKLKSIPCPHTIHSPHMVSCLHHKAQLKRLISCFLLYLLCVIYCSVLYAFLYQQHYGSYGISWKVGYCGWVILTKLEIIMLVTDIRTRFRVLDSCIISCDTVISLVMCLSTIHTNFWAEYLNHQWKSLVTTSFLWFQNWNMKD